MLVACGPVEDEEPEAGTTEEAEEEAVDVGNGTVGSIVGVTDVDSFSLSISDAVVKDAYTSDGKTASINVLVADRHNHPVADGTKVSFWSEYGHVGESCVTDNGGCSVTWVSQNTRPDDGLATIVAYSIGEDSFFDAGERNGIYNVASDSSLLATDEAIFSISELYYDRNFDGFTSTSFTDAGSGRTLDNDAFEDYNEDGAFNSSSTKYRGTKCSASAISAGHCAETSIQVWDHRQIVLNAMPLQINLPVGGTWDEGTVYEIRVSDANGNYPPSGTTISISEDTDGTTITTDRVSGVIPVPTFGSIPNSMTYHSFYYQILDVDLAGTLKITVTSGDDSTTIYVDHNP
jgi:hypothetical protein